MSRQRPLTQTSYVLLALVAVEPRSAYQLANHLTSTIVRASWPRAEAGLYAELKLLAGAGLLAGRAESNGRRGRVIYEITESGRTALASWFVDPSPSGPAFEWILPTKLLFSDVGGRRAFAVTLGHIREQLQNRVERVVALRTYELTRPDRLQVNVIGQLLLARINEALVNWLDDVEALDAARARRGGHLDEAVTDAHEKFFLIHERLLLRLQRPAKSR